MEVNMTFDEVVEKSTSSGHLTEKEVSDMKVVLSDMRNLASKEPFTRADKKRLDKLRDKFDAYAIKGMPDVAEMFGVSTADYEKLTVGKNAKYLLGILVTLVTSIILFGVYNANA